MYKTAWRIAKLTPILIAIEDCLCGPAFVRGRSMQPTLNPGDGDSSDLVLADKWSIKLYRYRRGDVVLLRYIDLSQPQRSHSLPSKPPSLLGCRWMHSSGF